MVEINDNLKNALDELSSIKLDSANKNKILSSIKGRNHAPMFKVFGFSSSAALMVIAAIIFVNQGSGTVNNSGSTNSVAIQEYAQDEEELDGLAEDDSSFEEDERELMELENEFNNLDLEEV